jgi:predicted nucleotidyltransferase
MRLVQTARAILDDRGIRYILIGAHAAAFYGVIRSTKDIDLLTTDRSVLQHEVWSGAGARVTIASGDAFDPLAGTVRLIDGLEQVDVVVGRWKFEEAIIARSTRRPFAESSILVPQAADLVLLKLAAGGPQDMWDIHELMRYVDRDSLVSSVDATAGQLPADAQTLWARVRSELTKGH